MSPLTDRLRRATTLVLVVAALVLGPQLAFATFGSSSAAPAVSVGTATMVAPTKVTGTYRCTLGWFEESLTVTIAGVTDTGPAGAKYSYQLIQDGEVTASLGPRDGTASFEGKIDLDWTATRWELAVTASIGGWTSPASTTVIRCPLGSSGRDNTGIL